jgi:hypothetical protein
MLHVWNIVTNSTIAKKTKASKRNKLNEFITPTNYHIFSLGELNPNHKGLAYYVTREF